MENWLLEQSEHVVYTELWVGFLAQYELTDGAQMFPSAQEMEAGRSEILGHPELCKKFQVSLDYLRTCFKK